MQNSNVSALTFAEISRTVDELGKRQSDFVRAQAMAAEHLAVLDEVTRTTDNDATLFNASRLAKRVRWLATHSDVGMLGPNGVAAEVRSLLTAAKFHGFREVEA